MDARQVLYLVQQYLHEHGYSESLASLERESGVAIESSANQIPFGELQRILDNFAEKEREDVREFELRMRQAPKVTPISRSTYILTSHFGNVLALALDASSSLLASGSADKTIRVVDAVSGELKLEIAMAAPVLDIAFHPRPDELSRASVLLAGLMDGSHVLLDVASGATIATWRAHSKFVNRVRWFEDGAGFVTASYDHAVGVFRRRAAPGSDAFELDRKLNCAGVVECLAFLPDSHTLLVGVRDDNYLHYVDLDTGAERQYNLNANGDDVVSFTAMDLAVSPDGDAIVVATDRGRAIVLARESAQQLRNLYAGSASPFGQPRCVWDSRGRFVCGAADENGLVVWDVESGAATRLAAPGGIVRALVWDRARARLLTGGYDHNVRVWE